MKNRFKRISLFPKMKWLLVIVIIIGTVIAAQAALQSLIYIPLVARQDPSYTPTITGTITITPTGSVTATPTITGTLPTSTPTITGTLPTPTPTRTITPTPTPIPGIFIVEIDYDPLENPLNEYVTIRNQYGKFIPLEGWTLRDEDQNVFTFPRYTLISYASVKVWTKDGVIDPENLYWGRSEPVWNDYSDCAYLRDQDGILVHSFCYGTSNFLRSLFSNSH